MLCERHHGARTQERVQSMCVNYFCRYDQCQFQSKAKKVIVDVKAELDGKSGHETLHCTWANRKAPKNSAKYKIRLGPNMEMYVVQQHTRRDGRYSSLGDNVLTFTSNLGWSK